MYVNVFFDNNLLLVLHVLNIVSLSSSTLQEIYHRGGKPERAMHCCHGTQAMDNNRICHHLLFNECGKQYFVQSFNGLRSMKLLRLSLNFTLELWSEFLTLMIDYAWIYLKRTQLQCIICTVQCEHPALVCHGPQLPCMRHLRSSGSRWRDSGLGISHTRRVFMRYLNMLI